jgi:methyl-accepting chemotaxis protein
MLQTTNILRTFSITIVAVVLITLGLGSASFMYYFHGVFARNVLAGVKGVTDGVDVELKNRENEFETRKSTLESDYLEEVKHDLAILKQTIPAPLWNLEPETAESIARAFLEKDTISGVRVDDDTGKLFAAVQKRQGHIESVKDPTLFAPDGKSMEADLFRADKKVGRVVLFYLETPLQQRLAQVDADLDHFRKENNTLVDSINNNLGTTIASQANHMLALRGIEMAAVFLVTAVAVSLFIRLGLVRPLSGMLNSLSSNSDQIRAAAAQVANSAANVADETSKEAAAVEETTATVEELSAMTRNNAQNATESNRLMTETRSTVSQANESMKGLFDSIEEIQRSSSETLRIIKTIDKIAFQTNILALNAAVESARAGEHGAGFGVVADEVRTLARQSAEAAKDTANLIENTHRQVATSRKLVEETRNRFTEVNSKVQHSSDLIARIAEASTEQAKGIEQLNSAIVSIDKAVQQTVASAEESASASRDMRTQSDEVDSVINNLRTMVGLNLETGRVAGDGDEGPSGPA